MQRNGILGLTNLVTSKINENFKKTTIIWNDLLLLIMVQHGPADCMQQLYLHLSLLLKTVSQSVTPTLKAIKRSSKATTYRVTLTTRATHSHFLHGLFAWKWAKERQSFS